MGSYPLISVFTPFSSKGERKRGKSRQKPHIPPQSSLSLSYCKWWQRKGEGKGEGDGMVYPPSPFLTLPSPGARGERRGKEYQAPSSKGTSSFFMDQQRGRGREKKKKRVVPGLIFSLSTLSFVQSREERRKEGGEGWANGPSILGNVPQSPISSPSGRRKKRRKKGGGNVASIKAFQTLTWPGGKKKG